MRKAITSKDCLFQWNTPLPINGIPILSCNTHDYVMNQTRLPVAVTAIASDRRTLTIANQPVSLQADQLRGFLLTGGDAFFSVKIVRLVGTTAILAEPLPREIDLTAPASLEFALWYATVTVAHTTGVSGYYPWEVNYVADLGQSTDNQIEKGTIKVTPRPFDTGLDHDSLVSIFANLADMIPRRQQDLTPQINAALEEIILVIRDHVIPQSVTEDEVFNPEQFKSAHAYCSAARVYEQNLQLDASDQMMNRCKELIDVALRSVSLDLDGDGIVDEGETNLRESGGSSRDFRASWSSYTKSSYDSSFVPKRGQRH